MSKLAADVYSTAPNLWGPPVHPHPLSWPVQMPHRGTFKTGRSRQACYLVPIQAAVGGVAGEAAEADVGGVVSLRKIAVAIQAILPTSSDSHALLC